LLREVEQKIEQYNQAVEGINACLKAMQLDRHQLPMIAEEELLPVDNGSEANTAIPDAIPFRVSLHGQSPPARARLL